jgi:hypothetical protein
MAVVKFSACQIQNGCQHLHFKVSICTMGFALSPWDKYFFIPFLVMSSGRRSSTQLDPVALATNASTL